MNYLETIKNITKDKERRTQNLILLIVLLVIVLIAMNFIFSPDTKTSNNTSTDSNIINSKENESKETIEGTTTNLESKLEEILSQISGISEVSVVLTYSQDTKQNIAYNTKEEEKDGNKTSEKTVAYNEDGSTKNAIIESVEMPKVEGAIVVAKGASSVDMRSQIATAISTVTNVPVYKIQVFEKQG